MKLIIDNESGAALLIVLALLALLGSVAIMSVDRTDTDVELSYNQMHEEQAFYVAEAGAKKAMLKLDEDRSWRNGYANEPIGAGNFTVVVIDSSVSAALVETILVRAVGNVQNASACVEISVVPEIINPYSFSLFGKSSVDVRNSFCTDSYNSDSGSYNTTVLDENGDIGSNGSVVIANAADIGGDVSTATEGALSINVGATITGDTTSTAPESDFPSITADQFNEAEANNSNLTGLSGSYSYNSVNQSFISSGSVTFTTGVYYFESFILKNSAELIIPAGDEVIIYVNGDIEVKNSGDINPYGDPGDLQFLSSGDVVLKNSSEFTGIVYAPDGEIDLRNSADVYGAVVGDDLINHNSACFHYDRNLGNIQWERENGVDQVAWLEVY